MEGQKRHMREVPRVSLHKACESGGIKALVRETPVLKDQREKDSEIMKQGDLIDPGRSPWASQVVLEVKNQPANAGDHKRCRFSPWVGKILWSRKWQPTPVFLPENPMDRGAWRATVHGVAKGRTGLKLLSTHAEVPLFHCGLQRRQ